MSDFSTPLQYWKFFDKNYKKGDFEGKIFNFFKKKGNFPKNFEPPLKNLLDNLCCGAEIAPENLTHWSSERTPVIFYAPELFKFCVVFI